MAKILEVPVEAIAAGDHELRAGSDDSEIDSLVASIRSVGVLEPLVCRTQGDILVLVAGHRRLEAARRAGCEKVPVIVRECTDAEAKEIAFAENMFRADLTPVEIAAGLKDVLEQGIMTVEELASSVHRSKNWIGSMIALLAWPDDVLAAIHAGWLSVSAANNLALVTDDIYRDFLLRNASDSGATARTTAAWLQAWRSFQPAEEAIQSEPVDEASRAVPACPQAPCLCCGEVYRTDSLSHVPVCVHCIKTIREIGRSG